MEKEVNKEFEIPMSGRWKPAFPGLQLAHGDFRILTNMRYKEKGIQAVKGMSKINTVVVTDEEPGPPMLGYTTQQMPTDGTQAITVTGGQAPFTWSIPVGGGSLDPTEGSSTTYTAPPTNPDCVLNPTIRVCDTLGQCVEFQMAINDYTSSEEAYSGGPNIFNCCDSSLGEKNCEGTVCMGDHQFSCCKEHFKCDNSSMGFAAFASMYCLHGPSECDCAEYAEIWEAANCPAESAIQDNRTVYMIAAGCCPVGLIT